MKKMFKKYGTVKCIGGLMGVFGLLLAIVSMFLGKFETAQLVMIVIASLFILVGLSMMALVMFKKQGTAKCIGGLMGVFGLLLAIVAMFFGKYEDAQLVMKIMASLFILVGLFVMALMAEKHKTFKAIGSIILSTFIISWILPYGYMNGEQLVNYGMGRLGLFDLGIGLYYAVSFTFDKLVFLFVLFGVYGVLSKTTGYQQLVNWLAKKLKGKEIVTALVMSLFTVAFTVMSNQVLMALVFVPFFASVLTKMKVEKITTFAITYGSIIIGILGTLYGTEALTEFNSYLGTTVETGLAYRGIILAVAFVLYNFFIVMRLRKYQNNHSAEVMEDPFEVETVTRKKLHSYPVVIVFVVVIALAVLGYISWTTNWSLDFLTRFHEWITNITVKDFYSWALKDPSKYAFGEDYTLFSYLLGQQAVALGSANFAIYYFIPVMVLASVILAAIYKLKANEYIEAFFDGVKKAVKPVLVVVAIYYIFILAYMSPFIPVVTNWVLGLTSSLNPFLASIMAFITSIFNADFGYTSYSVGSYLTTVYANNLDIIHTIYTSMYGLVQVFLPSSLVLMLGLALNNIDYKSWFKYIWLFVAGMFVILVIFFMVLLYI